MNDVVNELANIISINLTTFDALVINIKNHVISVVLKQPSLSIRSIFEQKMKLISGLIASALGHGRMMEPPSRSSYRHLPDDPNIAPFWDLVVPNWQDNELFCGGFGVQVRPIRISFIVNDY